MSGPGSPARPWAWTKSWPSPSFRDHGLPVVPFKAFPETEWTGGPAAVLRRIRRTLPLPLFVKPSNLGSSVGITKVTTYAGLPAALDTAFRYDAMALVEKGIIGRELELSVLGNESPEASLPGEVIPFRDFYDYNDKYIDGKTRFVIPAALPPRIVARIRTLGVAAFKALAASGMARVDFFLEKETDRLYVNEINTIPGFTEISMYPKLWAASGLPFPRLLERLVELGFERHRNRKACVERGALMRILGVDYGDRHIGLALSDPLLITAQPFGSYELTGRENVDRQYFKDLVAKLRRRGDRPGQPSAHGWQLRDAGRKDARLRSLAGKDRRQARCAHGRAPDDPSGPQDPRGREAPRP